MPLRGVKLGDWGDRQKKKILLTRFIFLILNYVNFLKTIFKNHILVLKKTVVTFKKYLKTGLVKKMAILLFMEYQNRYLLWMPSKQSPLTN